MAKSTQIVDIYAANLPIKESVSGTEKIIVSDGGDNKCMELSKVKEYAADSELNEDKLKGIGVYFDKPEYWPTSMTSSLQWGDFDGINFKKDLYVERNFYVEGNFHAGRIDGCYQILLDDGGYCAIGEKLIVLGRPENYSDNDVYNARGGLTQVYSKTEVDEKLSAKADTTKASTTSDGLMSKEDKAKLDGLSPKEQLFIDMWNSACGTYGKYNTETGFYELNGLTDITYEQALAIYRVIGCETNNSYRPNVRTILFSGCSRVAMSTWCRFEMCTKIEVIRQSDNVYYNGSVDSMFDGCVNLKAILGLVNINNITSYSYMFRRCVKLENFTFKGLNSNLTISDSPLITYNTLNYLISNALGNKVTTVSVHPTTYAYLQGTTPPTEQVGGTTEQWQALVTAATNKKISLATTV